MNATCIFCQDEYLIMKEDDITHYPELGPGVWICYKCKGEIRRKAFLQDIVKYAEDKGQKI